MNVKENLNKLGDFLFSRQYWFSDMEIQDGELLVGTEEGSHLIKLFPKIVKPVLQRDKLKRQPSQTGLAGEPWAV